MYHWRHELTARLLEGSVTSTAGALATLAELEALMPRDLADLMAAILRGSYVDLDRTLMDVADLAARYPAPGVSPYGAPVPLPYWLLRHYGSSVLAVN